LRKWVKDYDADPVYAFPGLGRMKSEQLEIDRLRPEVRKLKVKRDIKKKPQPTLRNTERFAHPG
jgi:transposase